MLSRQQVSGALSAQLALPRAVQVRRTQRPHALTAMPSSVSDVAELELGSPSQHAVSKHSRQAQSRAAKL
jgi:hypothetical protein